jgi:hypothetical protein
LSPFDHPVVSQRYFFGRAGAPRRPLTVQANGHELVCAAHPTDPAAPWLVHFHGNGELASDYEADLPHTFGQLGLNLLFAEYRGYGASSGTPRLAAMLDDVEHVLAATGAPPERCLVFGRSIGSIYAIELASRRPEVAGLVLESGIHDVLERIILRAQPRELGVTLEELRAEDARLFDHASKLSAFPNPCLLLHARGDHLVDVTHAQRNAAAAPDARLLTLPRGDHNSIMYANMDAYFGALTSLVEELFG